MSDAARLLGFAFANADFLFEIDTSGTILFATGAARDFAQTDAESLVGESSGRLFQGSEGTKFANLTRSLPQGGRSGPFRLKLVGGSEANVAMFRLPDNDGKISCTLTKPGPRGPLLSHAKDDKTGLPTRDSFLAAAEKLASESDSLTLLDVPALPGLCGRLPPEQADKLLASIGATIEGAGVKLAGRLSETGFGLIADAVRGPTDLAGRVRAALADGGLPQAMIQETLVSLKGRNLAPQQRMMAVRYVVERFSAGQQTPGSAGDLSEVFDNMIDETQARVRALTDTVADGSFAFAFQPIRDLETRELSHFEALARFKPGQTAETVQFAEALGIADAFDLAVALKVMNALESDTSHTASIAFNVSGHTVESPASFALLAGFLTRKRKLASRILIEITETAQIVDLESAAKAVTALRTLGYRVGLDDFGAGAASLNYLHGMQLDFLKFDGALVKRIGKSKRDDMLFAGLLKLSNELNITTIAECLETEEEITQAKQLGFKLGQGYALGKPAQKIPPGSGGKDESLRPAKRKGMRETWS
jgi:EAL domain-containing protein (putative c-di-GMP-specific phosphodiesterase class I)